MKNGFKIKNKQIVNIVVWGMKLCLLFGLIATLVLQLYCEALGPQAFYTGISLFKSCMYYIVTFIICGYVFDRYERG